MSKQIVILGAGYGGLLAALNVRKLQQIRSTSYSD